MQDASNYEETINDLCSGTNNMNMECENAANAVDNSCISLLSVANPAVCSGMCNTQLSRVAVACGSNVSVNGIYVCTYVARYVIYKILCLVVAHYVCNDKVLIVAIYVAL